MMVSARRFRSIGWIASLLLFTALVMVLAFRVNALRSQVHRTELRIISLRKEKLYLETEVETRANQQQLKLWNDVEFGFVAPSASQYLASERQLAAFAKPEGPDAPVPIRVASADDAIAAEAAFPSMIAQLAGQADLSAPADSKEDEAKPAAKPADAAERAAATANLGARLAMVSASGVSAPGRGVKGQAAGKPKEADRKPALAKAAKDAAKDHGSGPGTSPGTSHSRGARLTSGKGSAKTETKPGKVATARSANAQAKPAKPASKGSKPTP